MEKEDLINKLFYFAKHMRYQGHRAEHKMVLSYVAFWVLRKLGVCRELPTLNWTHLKLLLACRGNPSKLAYYIILPQVVELIEKYKYHRHITLDCPHEIMALLKVCVVKLKRDAYCLDDLRWAKFLLYVVTYFEGCHFGDDDVKAMLSLYQFLFQNKDLPHDFHNPSQKVWCVETLVFCPCDHSPRCVEAKAHYEHCCHMLNDKFQDIKTKWCTDKINSDCDLTAHFDPIKVLIQDLCDGQKKIREFLFLLFSKYIHCDFDEDLLGFLMFTHKAFQCLCEGNLVFFQKVDISCPELLHNVESLLTYVFKESRLKDCFCTILSTVEKYTSPNSELIKTLLCHLGVNAKDLKSCTDTNGESLPKQECLQLLSGFALFLSCFCVLLKKCYCDINIESILCDVLDILPKCGVKEIVKCILLAYWPVVYILDPCCAFDIFLKIAKCLGIDEPENILKPYGHLLHKEHHHQLGDKEAVLEALKNHAIRLQQLTGPLFKIACKIKELKELICAPCKDEKDIGEIKEQFSCIYYAMTQFACSYTYHSQSLGEHPEGGGESAEHHAYPEGERPHHHHGEHEHRHGYPRGHGESHGGECAHSEYPHHEYPYRHFGHGDEGECGCHEHHGESRYPERGYGDERPHDRHRTGESCYGESEHYHRHPEGCERGFGEHYGYRYDDRYGDCECEHPRYDRYSECEGRYGCEHDHGRDRCACGEGAYRGHGECCESGYSRYGHHAECEGEYQPRGGRHLPWHDPYEDNEEII